MSQRTYDIITWVCLLTAVASAVGFQHAEAYQIVAGIFGVVSALLAAATYYVYHIRSENRADGKSFAKPKDHPEASSQLSSHPQIRKIFATLSETPDTASVVHQAVLEALARDPAASSGKSVWESPVGTYRMEREIQQDIERELRWLRLYLLSSREAGTGTRMVRPKPYKGILSPNAGVHKVRPKPHKDSVWNTDTGAIGFSGSWSEAAHRAVA